MDTKNGGPAFPILSGILHDGMTLRDYFAAKAMQAYIREYFQSSGPCFSTEHLYGNVPAHAYRMADAMIKAKGET